MTSFDPNRPYYRKEIDIVFGKVKAAMHVQAVIKGNGVALYEDCYTGKPLRGGDAYDYEHIIASEIIFMQYRTTHTNQQIALLVNCPENVKTTLRTLNQSKGKTPLLNWLNPQNITRFGIDKNLAIQHYEKAHNAITAMAIQLK